MPSTEVPIVETEASFLNRRSASFSPTSDASSLSEPTPISTSPLPVPTPMFRALALPAPEPQQLEGQELLEQRLPGYSRVVLPREPTLLEILKQATGATTDADVLRLRSARLRVLAAAVSLRRLEVLTPRLRELFLDGSGLASLREIGTGLENLKVLHVNRCGLQSLDGLLGLTGLHELKAADNRITDIGPAGALHKINLLDLSGNQIADTRRLWQLCSCTKLRSLNLSRNPASVNNSAARLAYRKSVGSTLPQLWTLDEEALIPTPAEIDLDEDSIFENDLSDASLSICTREGEDKVGIIVDDLKTERRPASTPSERIFTKNLPKRPHTAHAMGLKDKLTANYLAPRFSEMPSLLTSGRVIQGNLTLALRRLSTANVVNAWFENINEEQLDENAIKKTLTQLRVDAHNPAPEKPDIITAPTPLEIGVTVENLTDLKRWRDYSKILRNGLGIDESNIGAGCSSSTVD